MAETKTEAELKAAAGELLPGVCIGCAPAAPCVLPTPWPPAPAPTVQSTRR